MSRRKQKVLLDSFEVNDSVLRPGITVMLRPPKKGAPQYIARIEEIEQDQSSSKDQVMLVCRWYYRPEESLGGRRCFHGGREVFLSDHVDRCFPESVEGECKVHTLRSYTALRNVTKADFFCRFQYNATTGLLSPDKVAVYCTCEMPFNPDCNMLFCTQCQDLFHPKCVGLPEKTSRNKRPNPSSSVERFVCPSCKKGMAGTSTVEQKVLLASGDCKFDSVGDTKEDIEVAKGAAKKESGTPAKEGSQGSCDEVSSMPLPSRKRHASDSKAA